MTPELFDGSVIQKHFESTAVSFRYGAKSLAAGLISAIINLLVDTAVHAKCFNDIPMWLVIEHSPSVVVYVSWSGKYRMSCDIIRPASIFNCCEIDWAQMSLTLFCLKGTYVRAFVPWCETVSWYNSSVWCNSQMSVVLLISYILMTCDGYVWIIIHLITATCLNATKLS